MTRYVLDFTEPAATRLLEYRGQSPVDLFEYPFAVGYVATMEDGESFYVYPEELKEVGV